MNFQVAKGAMLTIANASPDSLETMGITEADLYQVTDNIPWTGKERVKVVRTLEALLYAPLDILGLERFEVCAEYVAAIISVFVQPINQMLACSWMQGGQAAGTLAMSQDSISETVTASRLHALVQGLNNEGTTQYRDLFSTRVGIALEKAALASGTKPTGTA
jgi:hypothetical protein